MMYKFETQRAKELKTYKSKEVVTLDSLRKELSENKVRLSNLFIDKFHEYVIAVGGFSQSYWTRNRGECQGDNPNSKKRILKTLEELEEKGESYFLYHSCLYRYFIEVR